MKIEDILSHFTYHVQTSYLRYSNISDIYDLLPQCQYQGKAFRVVVNCDDKSFDTSPMKNLYWAKSMDGINYYLSLVKKDSTKTNSYILIEADVDGIDLNKAYKYLNSLTPDKDPRINPHHIEEEILAIDCKGLTIKSIHKF